MSNLSIDDVRHVARLARLGMSDDQLVTMADELDTIIDSIGKISELELDDIMPTTHALEITNVLGDDVPHQSLTREEALRNAPAPAPDGFRVPSMGT